MGSFFHSLSFFTLLVLVYTLLGNCVQVDNVADDNFSRYLRAAMSNYTSWIKRNALDPTPPTDNVIKSGMYDSQIEFDCQLRNHRVRGHSDAPYQSTSQSNFREHYFQIGWQIDSYWKYESDGDFNCNGLILTSDKYPGLNNSLPFHGQGSFRIFRNYSNESLVMQNVGITQDYKLDLSYAWPVYELNADHSSVQLQGEWNDTRIPEKYYENIKQRFTFLYENYPFFYDNTPSYPTGQVLYMYAQEVAQSVNLRQIITGNNHLPDRYVPTARASTAKRTGPSAQNHQASVQATAGLTFLQALLLICYYK